MTQLETEQYLVIGGSHGIGAGVVHRLLSAGTAVINVSRTPPTVDASDRLTHLSLDLTSDKLEKDHLPERLNGLIYCPGSINLGPLRQLGRQSMLEDYQLNVVSAVECLQAAVPALRATGAASAVFFSTVAVAQGMTMHASVASVKGAIEGLTRSLAAELAPKIRVNCIAPGLTNTPLSERFLSSEAKRSAMADKHPLKRVGEVEDIASLAAFLLRPEASWITGQVIGVDGGMSSVRG